MLGFSEPVQEARAQVGTPASRHPWQAVRPQFDQPNWNQQPLPDLRPSGKRPLEVSAGRDDLLETDTQDVERGSLLLEPI
jgi:hypothetical protein